MGIDATSINKWHASQYNTAQPVNDDDVPIFACSYDAIKRSYDQLKPYAQAWSQIAPPQTYGLNETAKKTGMKIYDILNIVRRENIIDPEEDERGYRFRERDIEILTLVSSLKSAAFRLPTIREVIAIPDHGEQANEWIRACLSEWLQDRTPLNYQVLINALADHPLLTASESTLYRQTQMGVPLSEAMHDAHLDGEPEARRVLENAFTKIGRLMPTLLHLL
jgi:DNA-binding transcriptional MerR regulator